MWGINKHCCSAYSLEGDVNHESIKEIKNKQKHKLNQIVIIILFMASYYPLLQSHIWMPAMCWYTH